MNERIKKLLKNICLILGQNITDITDNVIYGIKNYPMYGIGITNYNYVSNWWKYWLKVFGLNLLYSYLIIIINKKNLELGMIHSYIVKKLCWNYTHLHGHSKATEICHPHEHTKKPLSEILLKLLTYIYVIANRQLGQQMSFLFNFYLRQILQKNSCWWGTSKSQ